MNIDVEKVLELANDLYALEKLGYNPEDNDPRRPVIMSDQVKAAIRAIIGAINESTES